MDPEIDTESPGQDLFPEGELLVWSTMLGVDDHLGPGDTVACFHVPHHVSDLGAPRVAFVWPLEIHLKAALPVEVGAGDLLQSRREGASIVYTVPPLVLLHKLDAQLLVS